MAQHQQTTPKIDKAAPQPARGRPFFFGPLVAIFFLSHPSCPSARRCLLLLLVEFFVVGGSYLPHLFAEGGMIFSVVTLVLMAVFST